LLAEREKEGEEGTSVLHTAGLKHGTREKEAHSQPAASEKAGVLFNLGILCVTSSRFWHPCFMFTEIYFTVDRGYMAALNI